MLCLVYFWSPLSNWKEPLVCSGWSLSLWSWSDRAKRKNFWSFLSFGAPQSEWTSPSPPHQRVGVKLELLIRQTASAAATDRHPAERKAANAKNQIQHAEALLMAEQKFADRQIEFNNMQINQRCWLLVMELCNCLRFSFIGSRWIQNNAQAPWKIQT